MKDSITGNNQNLQWLIVAAFRYSVGRHPTQAMWGIENVILDNLDVLHEVFIKQFIDDIYNEKRIEKLHKEWKLSRENDIFYGLKGQVKDALRMTETARDIKAQELHSKLNEVMALIEEVDQDQIINREYVYKPTVYDTSYLNNMLRRLEAEYAKRLEQGNG